MSTPHPAALVGALATSRQALASWYAYFFTLPRIPVLYFLDANGDASRLDLLSEWLAAHPI